MGGLSKILHSGGAVLKNCCDYDAIVHYESGALGSKYKTDLTGKLRETKLDTNLRENDINSFKDSAYKTYIILEPLVLYRLFGQYLSPEVAAQGEDPKGAKLNGRYVSTEFAESIIDAKIRLALKPSWFNTKMYEAKVLVPAGTEISLGIVASVQLPTGEVLAGGAEQILLPYDWDKSWAQGYRRVTARQLQKPPQYWPSIPANVIKEKGKLYHPVPCPLCGFWDTIVLSETEQFEIVGKRGGKYTMKRKCLNPQCEYYW